MVTSYGETSGFAPVSGDELTSVNGGDPSAVIVILTVMVILAMTGNLPLPSPPPKRPK